MSEPKKEKNFYSRSELQEFREIIAHKLEEARSEHKSLANDLKELSGFSSDSANFTDFGSDAQEKEQVEMLMARQQKFILNLENALVRIENGSYGVCRVTGKLISKERLRVVPHTTTSVEGKMKLKK
ncbi:MAG: TraR/DksA C4-type zinc finger protein [Bacteroidota bacterium]